MRHFLERHILPEKPAFRKNAICLVAYRYLVKPQGLDWRRRTFSTTHLRYSLFEQTALVLEKAR